jgi:NAD+ synthase
MIKQLTIALAQMNPTVGALEANADAILGHLSRVAEQGADLLLTPEMALTGYPPEDLVLVSGFRQKSKAVLARLEEATKHINTAIILGTLWEDDGEIFNASVLIENGTSTLIRQKHVLPNSGVFDEKRVFKKGPLPEPIAWRGIRLGVLICEEVWNPQVPVLLKEQGAELLLVQNASPYHIGKARERLQVVQHSAEATGLTVVYLNMVGGQDELVFDGRSYVYHPQQGVVARQPGFTESLDIVTLKQHDTGWLPQGNAPNAHHHRGLEAMYQALVLGLRDYVQKNRFPGVVIGLSGGIDSGLSAAIAVDALGADHVHGVRMPSPYSSQHSLDDAADLAKRLGVTCDTVPIHAGMEAIEGALADVFAGRAPDVTEENIQARLRGVMLMAVSNKLGRMVLTTGNKSEMSVGYSTLYGDMCGGFSVLKDVYKTTVYQLSELRNTFNNKQIAEWGLHGAAGEVIPPNMISKPPSAELRPDQTDQDSLPDYDTLDTMLRGLIERRLSVAELVAEGMDDAEVTRMAKLVIGAEYKRRQSAPGVKITPMAFGRDRRWPITNHWRFA